METIEKIGKACSFLSTILTAIATAAATIVDFQNKTNGGS